MHYDPFQNQLQTNPLLGSYYGAPALANPFSAVAQGGIIPQQLALLATQAGAPQYQQHGLNPLLALASAAQQLAWQQQQQQQHSPYAQLGQMGQGGYPQQHNHNYQQHQLPFGYPQGISPYAQGGYPQQQQLPYGQQIGYPQQLAQLGYPQQQQIQGGYPQQQFGQQGFSPFAQMGNPYNQQPQIANLLAPQSWVGQGNAPYGQQIQPMLGQLGGRPFQNQQPSPWGF